VDQAAASVAKVAVVQLVQEVLQHHLRAETPEALALADAATFLSRAIGLLRLGSNPAAAAPDRGLVPKRKASDKEPARPAAR
jgi:hypothetical protein